MKYSITSALLIAATQVCAFPADHEAWTEAVKHVRRATPPQGAGALPLVPPPFDEKSQHVSVSGKYKFVAPKATDARGECPGLNAMANHGYLPHNGYGTIEQFTDACQTVYGMSPELALFLSTYGAVLDGDGNTWSVGSGKHVGIGGAHSNYESDTSSFRGDLNQYGNSNNLIMSQFMELYNTQPDAKTANYNLEIFRKFRGSRIAESIAKNPYMTYTPFAGIAVTQAGATFQYRFFGNKSAEYPEGILNKNVLKSFFAISGPEDNLKWTPGYERIPENWYKRNEADLYGVAGLAADILYIAEASPSILEIGCNQGKVNSYNKFDVSSLTKGQYTQEMVEKNPMCFAAAFAHYSGYNLLGLSAKQTAPLKNTLDLISTALGVTCAPLDFFDIDAAQAICPGLELYGGPTGPVAPGAIQS